MKVKVYKYLFLLMLMLFILSPLSVISINNYEEDTRKKNNFLSINGLKNLNTGENIGNSSSDTSTSDVGLLWNQSLGGTKTDFAGSIIQDLEGNFLIVGGTNSFSSSELFDGIIVKTNKEGQLIWNKTFGGLRDDLFWSIIETSDGGYAIAGFARSFGTGNSDAWLFKTDNNGNKEWDFQYGNVNDEKAYSILQTDQNDYILVGSTRSFENGDVDVFIVKISSKGEMIWNKTIGGYGTDVAWSTVQSFDGGIVIVGYTETLGSGGFDGWLIKVDSEGDVEFNKTYGGNEDERLYSIIQTIDKGFAFTGFSGSYGSGGLDVWMIKTDKDGNIEFNKTYGGREDDIAYDILQTSEGNFILSGSTKSYGEGLRDVYVVYIDSTGDLIWNSTFGGANEDIVYSIFQVSRFGNEFVAVGMSKSFSEGSYDMLVLKFGTNLKLTFGFMFWYMIPILAIFAILRRKSFKFRN
jgi:predicted secreted protein